MHEIDCKESSNLHWARWDAASQTLFVDFKNAAGVKVSTYEYRGFLEDDWQAFNAAESKGRHFAYAIRPRYEKGGDRFGLAKKVQPAAPAPAQEKLL